MNACSSGSQKEGSKFDIFLTLWILLIQTVCRRFITREPSITSQQRVFLGAFDDNEIHYLLEPPTARSQGYSEELSIL